MIESRVGTDVQVRARQSRGASGSAIYRTVGALLGERNARGTLADIGCGAGNLWRTLGSTFSRCLGVDAVRYEGLPAPVEFIGADFDQLPLPVPDCVADVVAAVEVIEHVENPRAFCRELARVAKPGGWIVMTTPNQLSVLSLLTLVLKGRFGAFQDGSYPAHISALLEVDLRRIAAECALEQIEIRYTGEGRIPGTGTHYPAPLSSALPRLFSDNVVLIGRTRAQPHAESLPARSRKPGAARNDA